MPKKVKALREALELTQEQFAAALGVHRMTVIAWEVGRTKRPSALAVKAMRRLAKRKGLIGEVLGG